MGIHHVAVAQNISVKPLMNGSASRTIGECGAASTSIAPPSHIAKQKNSTSGAFAPKPEASCDPSTDTDCAATTDTSHPPLIPSASGGFCALTVSSVNTVYVIAAHRRIPAPHNQ